MFSGKFVLVLVVSFGSAHFLHSGYHSNAELEDYLKNFTAKRLGTVKTRLYSIGKSTKQCDLWVVEVTAADRTGRGVPNVKLIGTVHGNEPVGREVLLYFMEYLRDNCETNEAVGWLLNNTRIHILANLNPDGFAVASENMCEGEHGRNNGLRGKDLNRNFPDYFHENRIPEEPETRAIRQWMSSVPFVLSAALHGGALVANYPFETVKERTSLPINPPSLTPDDDVFRHLATVYSQNHLTMHQGRSCPGDFENFEGGITNGAAWYPVIGGMQDYNYVAHGCMEITLEISCCKYPDWRKLPGLWEENKMALLQYCMQALRGVTGMILDAYTGQPVTNASLRIRGRAVTFFSTNAGEFWRILLPGKYKLEVSATGYYDRIVPFVVENYENSLPKLTVLNVLLLNISVTTTTEQKTTATTTSLPELTADGATTPGFTISLRFSETDEERKAADVVRIGRKTPENVSRRNCSNCHLLLLIFLICLGDLRDCKG